MDLPQTDNAGNLRGVVPHPYFNKKSWHRLVLTLIGVAVIVWVWYVSIDNLRTMKPEHVAAYTTLTVNAQYVLAALIIFMVTGRLVYEWKMSTTSQVIETGKQLMEDITERSPRPRDHEMDEDDGLGGGDNDGT